MKQKRLYISAFIFLFLIMLLAHFPLAQSIQLNLPDPAASARSSAPAASIAVYRLETTGADDSIVLVVSDLLFSFIREMRDYSLNFITSTRAEAEIGGAAIAQDKAHDFAFYGRLSTSPRGITLELFLKANNSKESRTISRVYENQNKLMLGTRLLIRDLFDSSPVTDIQDIPRAAYSEPQAAAPAFNFEALSLNDVPSIDSLSGSWSAEQGIERIMILRGGRGAAVFSSGFSLMLSLSVEAGELVVVQRGRSSPLQFVDLPDPVAEKAAEQAPPLEWRFRISDDGNILAGEKSTVQIRHDGTNILSITPTKERVAWVRN